MQKSIQLLQKNQENLQQWVLQIVQAPSPCTQKHVNFPNIDETIKVEMTPTEKNST